MKMNPMKRRLKPKKTGHFQKIQLSQRIYKKLEPHLHKGKVKARLRRICVASEDELDGKCEAFYVGTIRSVLCVLSVSIGLGTVLWIRDARADQRVVLERDVYGGEESETSLEVDIDGEFQTFAVDVLPLFYDADSIEEAFEKGFEYLDTVYLGENESADYITEDLNLVSEITELGFSVSWDSGMDDYVSYKGEITEETLDTPVLVSLTATLTYEDYEATRTYPVKIAGKTKDAKTQIIDKIRAEISELQQTENDSATLVLPEEVQGYTIRQKKGLPQALLVFGVGICICILLVYKGQSDLREKEKNRNKALMEAYPGFIDFLVLYMGAGLTVKGTLKKISDSGSCDILSEELRYTLNEIASGIPETEGYYRLGARLQLPMYHKIMTLLAQNIKKGTRDILNLLFEEETAALQLKRELAKKKGEEAGTKLLFPMILQLAVVMVIVIAPALMGF